MKPTRLTKNNDEKQRTNTYVFGVRTRRRVNIGGSFGERSGQRRRQRLGIGGGEGSGLQRLGFGYGESV